MLSGCLNYNIFNNTKVIPINYCQSVWGQFVFPRRKLFILVNRFYFDNQTHHSLFGQASHISRSPVPINPLMSYFCHQPYATYAILIVSLQPMLILVATFILPFIIMMRGHRFVNAIKLQNALVLPTRGVQRVVFHPAILAPLVELFLSARLQQRLASLLQGQASHDRLLLDCHDVGDTENLGLERLVEVLGGPVDVELVP